MKKIVFLIMALELFLLSPAFAKTYQFNQLNGKRQITFYSKASVESFEGVVSEWSGMLTLDETKKNLGLKGRISMPVMSMATGITTRDVHMRSKDWLNENRYPTIQFEVGSVADQVVKKKGKNKWFVEMKGRFSLKGRSKAMVIPVTLTKKKSKKGDLLIAKGGFTVNLKDYGIKGPLAMKMIGAKVSPTIKISLKLTGKSIN